ncbi:MAG: hypothetical protein N2246_06290, partial [Candidatus Sumerlaeia bacterium]|nr:hypothetical protein [Candidatus Sumerlaeia bacterium]
MLITPQLQTLFICYFIIAVLLFEPFSGKGGDDCFYYSYLTSLMYDGDLLFYNDLANSNNPVFVSLGMVSQISDTGLVKNPHPPGTALLVFPFFLIGYLIDSLIFGTFTHPQLDRYSFFVLYVASLASVFYVLLGLYLLFGVLTRYYSSQVSLWSLICVFVTSPLIMYTLKFGLMSHSYSFFAVCLLTYLCLGEQHREEHWRAILLGLTLGLIFLIRWQDIILILFPALIEIFRIQRSDNKIKIKSVAIIILSFAPFLCLQCLCWKIIYGKFLTLPQGEEFFQPLKPHLMKFLFSGWNGLFATSPFLLIAIIGLGFMWLKNRLLTLILLLVIGLHIYVCSANVAWFGGMSFGARRIITVLPFFTFGFASIFEIILQRTSGFKRIFVHLMLIVILFIHILFVIFTHRGTFTYYALPYQLWLWLDIFQRLLQTPLLTTGDSYWLKFLLWGRHIYLSIVLSVLILVPILGCYLFIRIFHWINRLRVLLIITCYLFIIILISWLVIKIPKLYTPGLLLRQALQQETKEYLNENLVLLTQALQTDPTNCILKFKYLVTRLSQGETERNLTPDLLKFAWECGKFGSSSLFSNKHLPPELKQHILQIIRNEFLFDEYITGNVVLGFLQFGQADAAKNRLAKSYISPLPYMELRARLAEEQQDWISAAKWWRNITIFQPASSSAWWKLRELSINQPEAIMKQCGLDSPLINKKLSHILETNYKIAFRGTRLYASLHPHWQPTLIQATTELGNFLIKTGRYEEAFSIVEETDKLIGSEPAFIPIYTT